MEFKKWNINDTPEITIPEMNDNLDLIQEELRKAQVVKQLENLIKNGDFSDGMNGWRVIGNGEGVVENGVMSVLGAPTIQTREGVSPNTTLEDIIYYSFEITDFVKGGITIPAYYFKPTDITYKEIGFHSAITKYASLNLRLVQTFVNDSDLSYSNVSLINLTQIFGAGNEPTKEFCDSIMEVVGWFDGQYDLTTQEMFIIIAKWSQAQNVNHIMTLPHFETDNETE